MFWDFLRFVILIMYGFALAETVWVGVLYFKFCLTRGMRFHLTRHVWLVSLAFVLILTEAVYQNAARVGEGFSWYVVLNTVVVPLAYCAMRDIRVHVQMMTRRGI